MKQFMRAIFAATVILLCVTTSLFAQDSLNVRQVGFCNIPDRGIQLRVEGNYAYIASMSGGMRIVNVSNPSAPYEVAYFRPTGRPSEAYGVAVSGNYAFTEDYYQGMRVVDVSNPASPLEVGSYQHGSDGRGIAVAGSYAYLAADYQGLKVVNISNPTAPVLAGSFSTSGRSHHVTGVYPKNWTVGCVTL